jgi:hypothetical protein
VLWGGPQLASHHPAYQGPGREPPGERQELVEGTNDGDRAATLMGPQSGLDHTPRLQVGQTAFGLPATGHLGELGAVDDLVDRRAREEPDPRGSRSGSSAAGPGRACVSPTHIAVRSRVPMTGPAGT